MLIRQIELSRRIADWLFDHDKFQVLPESNDKESVLAKTYMIVLFRARDSNANEKLVQKIKDSGQIYVSGTVWEGTPAARIAVSNWRVNIEEDLKVVKQVLDGVV